MSRSAGAVGMVFAEAVAKGKFITYGMDREVEKAYRNIERDFPRLQCAFDKENMEHMIVEHCSDGSVSLVLNSRSFHEDLIRLRIHRADSTKFDPMDEIERAEQEVEARHDAMMHEAIGNAGEKLAHAFAADGLTVRPRSTPLSVRMRRRNTLANFEAPTRTMSNR